MNRLSRITTAKTIRVLIQKGDHAADKAEQFYKAAGYHLKNLQATKPMGVGETWEDYVKKHCGIGIRRAQELIAIADGRTTLEKVRATKAESMRRLRQDAPRGAPPDLAASRAELQADWLAQHPGKTTADFAATCAWSPRGNPDALPLRDAYGPSNLEVAAEILGLGPQGDEIVQRLKKYGAELDRVAPYLKPPEVAEIREAYRKIITVAQDGAAHLNKHDRFQVIANPETAPSVAGASNEAPASKPESGNDFDAASSAEQRKSAYAETETAADLSIPPFLRRDDGGAS